MSGNTIRMRIASEADLTRTLLETGKTVREIGFEAAVTALVNTAVSELGRNILKYAGAGEMSIERVKNDHHSGVRVTAQDNGPGIADIDQAMADHFSSAGTLGLGLPGVKRMMDEFAIDSALGKGTRVVITKWITMPPSVARASAPRHRKRSAKEPSAVSREPADAAAPLHEDGETSGIDWGVFQRPCVGEQKSGDTAVVVERPDVIFLAMIDVLGHGPEAHRVATFIEGFLQESWTRDPVALTLRLHEELKGMRGAAAGMAVLNIASGEVVYVGVGNTVIRRFGSRETRLPSVDGTLGQSLRSPVLQTLRLGRSDVLLLYTDGVRSSFKLDEYPQLQYEGSATISRKVVEQFGRSYDDATCLALRYKR